MTDDIFTEIRTTYNAIRRDYWKLCDLAAQVVGKRDGATQRIATENHVEVDTVEGWARAGRLANRLGDFESETLRESLTYSHFSAVGKCMEEGTLSESDAFDKLYDAAKVGVSVRQLREQLPRLKPEPTFINKLAGLHSYVRNLLLAPYITGLTTQRQEKLAADVRENAKRLQESIELLSRELEKESA